MKYNIGETRHLITNELLGHFYYVYYRGKRVDFHTEAELYIKKWCIRNNFRINAETVDKFGADAKTIKISVEKYGIYRTIDIPPTTENIKLYLDLFKRYYEALRGLKDAKSAIEAAGTAQSGFSSEPQQE